MIGDNGFLLIYLLGFVVGLNWEVLGVSWLNVGRNGMVRKLLGLRVW